MPPDADVISPQALECFPQVRHWDFLSFLHTTENPPVFKLVIASFSIFLCLFSLMYIIQFFSFAVGLTHILGLLFFFFLTSPSCVCVCLFIIWQRDCLSICTYSLAFPWVFWEHSITWQSSSFVLFMLHCSSGESFSWKVQVAFHVNSQQQMLHHPVLLFPNNCNISRHKPIPCPCRGFTALQTLERKTTTLFIQGFAALWSNPTLCQ